MSYLKNKYIEEAQEREQGADVAELEQEFEAIMKIKQELTDKYSFEVGFYEARTHYFLTLIEDKIDEAKRDLHLTIFETRELL